MRAGHRAADTPDKDTAADGRNARPPATTDATLFRSRQDQSTEPEGVSIGLVGTPIRDVSQDEPEVGDVLRTEEIPLAE